MKSETKSGTKFLPGDIVMAVEGEWAYIERFTEYEVVGQEYGLLCLKGIQNEEALFDVDYFEFSSIATSPLYKALS